MDVATKVELRQRGSASAALKVAQEFLHDPLQVDFGLMITTDEMVPHYKKVDWSLVSHSLMIDQQNGKARLDYTVLVQPVCRQDWPEGEIDLSGRPW